MANSAIPCPVCGKPFVPCKTDIPGAYNWRQVACSWACAEIYIERIQEQRRQAREAKSEQENG